MAEVRNYTMNFGSGVTLASQALASATTSGRRRALWPALVYLLRTEIHG
jgi:hypothetical protein